MALFIQFHYKREVYYERTLQYNSLQLAYYKQTVNKNAVLRQTAPNIDKIYQQDLLKGRSLPFHKALCT